MSENRLASRCAAALFCAVLALSTASALDWEVFPSSDLHSSGDVMEQRGNYSIHNGDFKYGKGSPDCKWQGFVRFDLSELPDSLWVEEAIVAYEMITASNPPAVSHLTHVTVDPLTAVPADLWNAIVGGPAVSRDTAARQGIVERPLDSLGVAAIQNGIADDWVGFGVYKWDTTSTWGHIKGYQTGRFKPRIRLRLQARDLAVARIIAPTGEYHRSDTITPTAVIHNNGEISAPFRVWFTISTGTRVIYRQTVDLPGLTPGRDTTLRFADWPPDAAGVERVARCSLAMLGDFRPENNFAVSWFALVDENRPVQPHWGWQEVAPVPLLPSARPVKLGAWLAANSGNGRIYCGKGNKSADFASYSPVTGQWRQLATIPLGLWHKSPGKGARGVADGGNSIYFLKGNRTCEFWRYDIAGDSWQRLADVPAGPNSGSVRAGTGMVYLKQYGTGYVYVLKGPKNDFARYNTDTGEWEQLQCPPIGGKNKWDRGSWVVSDGESKIYAHKSNRHELWSFNLADETWDGAPLPPMPYFGSTLRSKKMRDGGCAAWLDGSVYSLKGGKTQEFWRFTPSTGRWVELETIPRFGTSLKPVRMGAGGDFVAWPYGGALYALKGSKSLEFWRYTLPPPGYGEERRRGSDGAAGIEGAAAARVRCVPGVARDGRVRLEYSLPEAGAARVTVHDAAGRIVRSEAARLGRTGSHRLDLSGLAAGVYLVRVDTDRAGVADKLVLAR